jgi:hypothetical protein
LQNPFMIRTARALEPWLLPAARRPIVGQHIAPTSANLAVSGRCKEQHLRRSIPQLAAIDVRVHCLALGGTDLTSPAGRMTMGVIAAVAEFERDLLIERTQAGLSRAKAEGKRLGRPPALTTALRVNEPNSKRRCIRQWSSATLR